MSDRSAKLAADTLGVSTDADAAAVRAAFLQHLAAKNFLPSEASLAALTRLSDLAPPLPHDAIETLAKYETADVEAFVEVFWTLEPAERQKRWDQLTARCQSADAKATLARLVYGLTVSVVKHDDESLDEMADFIRTSFLLPPRARTARRLEWCAEQPGGKALRLRAARFRQADPKLAAFDPQLFEYMLAPPKLPLSVAAAPSGGEAKPQKGWSCVTVSAGCLAIVLGFCLCVNLVDWLLPNEPYRPSEPQPRRIIVSPPAQPNRQFRGYTLPQLEANLKYDANPTLPKPDGYDKWVADGKPFAPPPPAP